MEGSKQGKKENVAQQRTTEHYIKTISHFTLMLESMWTEGTVLPSVLYL